MAILNPTRQKLISNVAWLYALQGLNYVLPLAVLPYLVRVLGVERYGLLAFAQAFAQYFVILADYGFNLSATKQIARRRGNREDVSRLFWSVLFIKFVLMLFGCLVLFVILAAVPRFRADSAVYVIAYVAVPGSILFPLWLFQGMEQMRYISIVSGGARVLSAILLFIFVHHSSDYMLALAIQSGGVLLAGVAALWTALSNFDIDFCRPSRADISQALRDGWHLFVSSAATTLYANTGAFLVGMLAGNVQAGYFGAADKINRGIQGLLAPVTQAVYPHVSLLAAKSRDAALAFIRKSLIGIGLVSFLPSLLVFLFARSVALFVFGSITQDCVITLRWMAMLPFVIAVSSVFAIQTMIPMGFERQLSRVYVLAGLGSLALSVPLILHYGAAGGGASVLMVEIFVDTAMWSVLRRHGVHVLRAEPVVARI